MNVRTKRNFAISAIALAAVVVACSNEQTSQAALDAGQQVLSAALPAAEADAQTPTAKAPNGPANALPKGTYQLQLLQIPDPSGRMKSPIAARILVPAGWKAEGGVIWPAGAAQNCAEHSAFAWAATSPDGKSSFELFPTELWQASNSLQTNCKPAQFQDIRSYLTAYAQANVQGATNFKYRERPDLLEAQREVIESLKMLVNNQYADNGVRFWPDAGELTFTYTENGTPMKGVIGATGRFYAGQAYNPLGGPPLMTLTAQTNYTYAASAPAADFDAQLVEMIRRSVKPDYTWAYHYSEYLTEMSRRQTGIVKDRAEQIVVAGYQLTQATIARNQAAGNAAVAKAYADPPITGGGTDDRSQRERVELIRGVETYDDPVYGGTVQLDNTYDNAWRVNNNDSYILTNDPNFNPGAYNIDAQQLKVTR
jgi:hypothetical protein